MTLEEIRTETMSAFYNMIKHVNEWTVRDVAAEMSNWGFWKGEVYINTDEAAARKILEAALITVKEAPEFLVKEMYEKVYHYA